MATIKGQNLRVFIGTPPKCVAASTSCTVHLAADLQDSSTKDSTGDWQQQQVVGFNWDMSVDALIVSNPDEHDVRQVVLNNHLGDYDNPDQPFENTDGYWCQYIGTWTKDDNEFGVDLRILTEHHGQVYIAATAGDPGSIDPGDMERISSGSSTSGVDYMTAAEIETALDSTLGVDEGCIFLLYVPSEQEAVDSQASITFSSVITADDSTDIADIEIGDRVQVMFERAGGTMNRYAGNTDLRMVGEAIVSDIQVNAPNRADSSYTLTLQGDGDLTIG